MTSANTPTEIDDPRRRARPERSGDERNGSQVRFGQNDRIAQLSQRLFHRLTVFHTFSNVAAKLHLDLRPQSGLERQLRNHPIDVHLVGVHVLSGC